MTALRWLTGFRIRARPWFFPAIWTLSALPNLEHLAKNADLLVFNCAVLDPPESPAQLYDFHTPPRKIGEATHVSGAKSLLLSHIAGDIENAEGEVRKSIRASYAGPVAFATDKMTVPVGK